MTPALFHETIEDAIREVIMAAGGFKEVGNRIRPDLVPDRAASWLRDCVNDDRRQHIDPHQLALLRRIGREANCHALATWEARDAGYTDPLPIEPLAERDRLQRDFIAAAHAVQEIAARLDRMASPSVVPMPPSQMRSRG